MYTSCRGQVLDEGRATDLREHVIVSIKPAAERNIADENPEAHIRRFTLLAKMRLAAGHRSPV